MTKGALWGSGGGKGVKRRENDDKMGWNVAVIVTCLLLIVWMHWYLSIITHLHQDDVWVFSSLFSSQNLGGGWPQPIRELSKHISQRPHASSAVSPSLCLNPAIFFHSSFLMSQEIRAASQAVFGSWSGQPHVTLPSCFAIEKPRLCPCHRNGHRQKTPPFSSSKFRFGRVKL